MTFLDEFRENEKFDEPAVISAAAQYVKDNMGEVSEVAIFTEYDRKGYTSRDALNEYNKSYRGYSDELVILVAFRVSEHSSDAESVVAAAKEALHVRDEASKAIERAQTEQRVSELQAELAALQGKLSNIK